MSIYAVLSKIQSLKAWFPMTLNDGGKVKLAKVAQLLNANLPIWFTDWGIIILERDSQSVGFENKNKNYEQTNNVNQKHEHVPIEDEYLQGILECSESTEDNKKDRERMVNAQTKFMTWIRMQNQVTNLEKAYTEM